MRSGRSPEHASIYLAPLVTAHQLISESRESIDRTPAQYAEHIRDLDATWGPFTIEVEELLVDGDKVYARWTQHGHDRRADPPQTIRQITSAVYRVRDNLIVEYWIQIDRLGIELQRQASISHEPF